MGRTLYELFEENPAGPVQFRGREVCRAIQLPVTQLCNLQICVESFKEPPRQGIRITAKGCKIDVLKAHQITEPILWAADFRRNLPVTLKVWPTGKNAVLVLYNAWSGPSGRLDAWLMEAGMIIEPGPDQLTRVLCSDGVGPADFTSLVFTYQWV